MTNNDEENASGYVGLLEHKIAIGCIFGNPTVPPEAIDQLKTSDGMGAVLRRWRRPWQSARSWAMLKTFPWCRAWAWLVLHLVP